MSLIELSGLVAALCWTLSSLMAPKLISEFGSFRFNTVRIVMASLTLVVITLLFGLTDDLLWSYSVMLFLSGLIGIFIGDSCLFSSVNRLGPRRAGILFATNAPMSIIVAWIIFGETLGIMELTGCALVTIGAVIAILYGKRRTILVTAQANLLEDTKGSLAFGITIALVAALCQVSGAILSKPALLAGVDPIAVSAFRVTAGALALLIAYNLYYRHQTHNKNTGSFAKLSDISLNTYAKTFVMATIGMVIGMSVLVWGIGRGNIGVVTTLSATVPVLILPALWITTGQRPAIGAWIGAFLVVTGAALIILF